jgi:predicted neutral ceramidase superfamily lipid hydrolase
MSRARRLAYLILLAVAVLTLALIILIRSRSLDDDLLAAIGLLGGLAIVVVALPVANGNGKP